MRMELILKPQEAKAIREKTGLNRHQFANRCHLSHQSVQRAETIGCKSLGKTFSAYKKLRDIGDIAPKNNSQLGENNLLKSIIESSITSEKKIEIISIITRNA